MVVKMMSKPRNDVTMQDVAYSFLSSRPWNSDSKVFLNCDVPLLFMFR